MLEWIIANKELIKIFYALALVIICLVIVLKSDRLFRLSNHTGIRYFRNAFFFFGMGFFVRYFICSTYCSFLFTPFVHSLFSVLFEYLLVMAGFFLLYSLVWKRFESDKPAYYSSLFNSKILVFYVMAVLIVFLDYIWGSFFFMFFSQILIFILASVVSAVNYSMNGGKRKFLKFYFAAMTLALAAWVLNAVAALLLNWHPGILVVIYILNLSIFLLFLFGVIKVTKRG